MSILFVTDDVIHDLNRQYRAVNSATDVLAFSMREGEFGDINPDLLGDIVISVETAQRQALEAGHPFEQELAVLLVHGLLHLGGFDHDEEGQARLMEKKSEEILQKIVIPALREREYF